MAKWWDNLKNEQIRLFGFIKTDVVRSSSIHVSSTDKRKDRGCLKKMIHGIVMFFNGKLMSWNGDGGVFIFLIDASKDYSLLPRCALELHKRICPYKGSNALYNNRITCHVGLAPFSSDVSVLPSHELDEFSKAEKENELGESNCIIITEDIYDEIVERETRDKFKLFNRKWNYSIKNQQKSLNLYIYPPPLSQELPEPIVREEMIKKIADSFSKNEFIVETHRYINGIEVDLILTKIKDQRKTMVECKVSDKQIGAGVIRNIYARFMKYGKGVFQNALIISNNGFTPEARALADQLSIILWKYPEDFKA